MYYFKTLSIFLSEIIVFLLLINIVKRCKKNEVKSFYVLFVLNYLIWSFSTALFNFPLFKNQEIQFFLIKMMYFTGSILPSSFLNLSFSYPLKEITLTRFKQFFIFLPNLIFFALIFFTDLMIKNVFFFGEAGNHVIHFGPLQILWNLYFCIVFPWAFIRFFIMQNKIKFSLIPQIKYLLSIAVFATIVAWGISVYMPWFHNYFYFSWLSPILMSTFSIYLGYIIFYDKLKGIKNFLKKSLIYSTMFSFLIIFYLSIIFIVKLITVNSPKDFYTFVPMAAMSANIIIIFPLLKILNDFFDKNFFAEYSQISEENKILKQKINQTEKYEFIATLTSAVAHEMKNPLTALNGYCFHLPNRLDDKNFLIKFSKVIKNEVDRLADLVQQLMDYGVKNPMNFRETKLIRFINEIIDTQKDKFTAQKINTEKFYDFDKNFSIFLDEKSFKKTIVNIINNSIEAMPQGGTLTIKLQKSDDSCLITIEDTGYGIADENLENIFKPFYSLKDQNRGLGLTIAQSIIEDHKGSIKVESKINKGTSIIIKLPIIKKD